jgi:hypothetical protein
MNNNILDLSAPRFFVAKFKRESRDLLSIEQLRASLTQFKRKSANGSFK